MAELYISGYLKQPQDARYISEHACKCGATSLLDHLDAERSYRSAQLDYRQMSASYLRSADCRPQLDCVFLFKSSPLRSLK